MIVWLQKAAYKRILQLFLFDGDPRYDTVVKFYDPNINPRKIHIDKCLGDAPKYVNINLNASGIKREEYKFGYKN